jgi:hypothetical protein
MRWKNRAQVEGDQDQAGAKQEPRSRTFAGRWLRLRNTIDFGIDQLFVCEVVDAGGILQRYRHERVIRSRVLMTGAMKRRTAASAFRIARRDRLDNVGMCLHIGFGNIRAKRRLDSLGDGGGEEVVDFDHRPVAGRGNDRLVKGKIPLDEGGLVAALEIAALRKQRAERRERRRRLPESRQPRRLDVQCTARLEQVAQTGSPRHCQRPRGIGGRQHVCPRALPGLEKALRGERANRLANGSAADGQCLRKRRLVGQLFSDRPALREDLAAYRFDCRVGKIGFCERLHEFSSSHQMTLRIVDQAPLVNLLAGNGKGPLEATLSMSFGL